MECEKYEVIREGEESILRFDCAECPFFPSVEDEPRIMAFVIDALSQVGKITKLLLVQKRDIEYDEGQVAMLGQIAQIYKQASSQRLSYGMMARPVCAKWINPRYVALQNLLQRLLKSDPVGAYI